jgi:hypothetical protein
MSATRTIRERLATPQRFREQVRVRHASLGERFARIERRDAFLALFRNMPRKPDALYELTRAEDRRMQLPSEWERALIQQAIAQGHITETQIVEYCTAILNDFLAMYPEPARITEVTFTAFATETAEALEAQAKAATIGGAAAVQHAITQTREAIAAGAMLVAVQVGSAA